MSIGCHKNKLRTARTVAQMEFQILGDGWPSS